MTKDELRKWVYGEKKKVSVEDKITRSHPIWEQISQNRIFQNAKTILLYWSMNDEVCTHDFVQQCIAKNKVVLLPVVEGDNLLLKRFTEINALQKGEQFGIGEPTGEEFTDVGTIDLIIVPGIAFDKRGNRMGRGRGYYDRLLSTNKAYKIGVGFDFQIFDIIPTEVFDVPMDCIVGEHETYSNR